MNQELYHTESLNLAAYIKCNGVDVVKTGKKGEDTVFYFPKNDQVKQLVDMYKNDLTLKRFIISFRDIKNMTKS